MSKHTPGPWYFADPSNEGSWGVYHAMADSAIDLTICHIRNRSTWHDIDGIGEANARLIAAAPSLLEALKLIVQWDEAGLAQTEDLMSRARAAIAKAEGA